MTRLKLNLSFNSDTNNNIASMKFKKKSSRTSMRKKNTFHSTIDASFIEFIKSQFFFSKRFSLHFDDIRRTIKLKEITKLNITTRNNVIYFNMSKFSYVNSSMIKTQNQSQTIFENNNEKRQMNENLITNVENSNVKNSKAQTFSQHDILSSFFIKRKRTAKRKRFDKRIIIN